jgi:predicted ATP-dependent endonuclease of OLD family
MLESVLIRNFKGFKNTSIGPFRKVNVLIGGQNVGKTSVLEAIQIGLDGGRGTVFRQNEGKDAQRFSASALGNPELMLYASLSNQAFVLTTRHKVGVNQNLPISIDSLQLQKSEGGTGGAMYRYTQKSAQIKNSTLCVSVPLFLPPQLRLVTLFGQVTLSRKKRELTDLLKKVEPRLISLDAISPDGEQRVYAELEGIPSALPLTQMGHGFSRLLYLFSEMLVSEAQIALIDEVENGIHYSALPTLFAGVKAVAQDRDVQSVITTHSWDALRAACEAFEDAPEMFQVIRLERQGEDVKAVCIDGQRMLRLMADEREVR